ncbi:hypothetical protein ACJRO7_012456 [Eucalyptus globulus]|uniref:RNase H type-1 domain-containing protein n=1 Tax=Eucalyptus globulus TaxID=34317 RepID=A0ABD3LP69_EUCGL
MNGARSKTHEIEPPQPWIPPHKGALKINLDGTYEPGMLGNSIACVCRDSGGRLVEGVAKEIKASSPLMAETLALWEAIDFFYSKRHEALIFESDSSQLVQVMNRSNQLSWEIQHLISKCKEKLRAFTNFHITHCYREVNMVAD